jgi:ferredoxin
VRVTVDREVCIGSGNCVYTAPEVFEQDDEGLVVLVAPGVARDVSGEVAAEVETPHEDAVRAAVAHCPSGALRIVGD